MFLFDRVRERIIVNKDFGGKNNSLQKNGSTNDENFQKSGTENVSDKIVGGRTKKVEPAMRRTDPSDDLARGSPTLVDRAVRLLGAVGVSGGRPCRLPHHRTLRHPVRHPGRHHIGIVR